MLANIDMGRAALVIVLTVLGVVIINLVIYAMVRGKGTTQQIELMRKAVKQTRNPWEVEDNALKDLSELVKNLKQNSNPAEPGNEPKADKDGNEHR